jgi:hypothetical protein
VLGLIVLALAIAMCVWVIKSGAPQALATMQANFQQQSAIDRAIDRIHQLPGIQSVQAQRSDANPRAYDADGRRAHVRIQVATKPGITTAQLAAAAQAIRIAWTDPNLANTVGNGVISVPHGATFTLTARPTQKQLANELKYWAAVQAATGTALNLTIAPATDGPGYARALAPVKNTAAATTAFLSNYSKVLAVTDVSSAHPSWTMPGIRIDGSLPPASLISLTSKLTSLEPLVPPIPADGDRGFAVEWTHVGKGVAHATVILYDRDPNSLNDSRNWSAVVDSTRAVIAAKIPSIGIRYVGATSGQLTLGGCKDTVSTDDQDTTLVTALMISASGLPKSTLAGHCVDAATK